MAKSGTRFCVLYAPIFCLALAAAAHAHAHAFRSIYAFGDSLTDTGNVLIYLRNLSIDALQGRLPYGETFFHKPTGRFSDGRLVVDFLAKRVGAPDFLLPFLGLDDGKEQSLINFAVAGATAENVDYLKATFNISNAYIPYSLDRQLQWFSTLPIANDKEDISKALFYLGEMGTNDYNVGLLNGFSVDRIITELVPNAIKVIKNSLQLLIQYGVKYLVVEGAFPFGCTPAYRLLFVNATTDKYGCLDGFYKLNKIHDKLLKQVVHNLTIKYNQDVHITFFDQLKAYFEIIKRPSHYGFSNTMDSCLDINVFQSLNVTNVKACRIPSTYVSWDGIHYTDATSNVLLNLFYTKGFVTPYPSFLTSKSF